MENRSHAIIAVSFLIVFVIGAIAVYYWLADRQHEPLVYDMVTSQSVGGLAPQSAVRFKGLVVGHVASVGFDPRDRSRVIVRLHLKRKTWVTDATYAEIDRQGLTGGRMVVLKLGPGDRSPLPTSAAHPATIPLRPGLIASLETSAKQDMQDLHAVLASAKKLLGASNRQHLAATLKQLDSVTRKLAAIETQMPALIAQLQRSATQSHTLLADADSVVRAARTPVEKATKLEASINALAHSSRQLSATLQHQSAPDFDALSNSLLQTSHRLDQLLRELKAKPQSLIFGPPKRPPGPGEAGFKPHPTEPPQP